MIGRKVRVLYHGDVGEAVKWEPLSSGMCNVLLRREDGSEIWCSSNDCRPTDDLGPLPSRALACEVADRTALLQLQTIEANLVRDRQPWPGLEFGKAIVGRSLQAARRAVKSRLSW